ncbi:hypothetical protein EDP1_3981 [Pseudomonas putida S610]|nr:hypothetical protein EDP1_3981 [Pseudomonas putida S610]
MSRCDGRQRAIVHSYLGPVGQPARRGAVNRIVQGGAAGLMNPSCRFTHVS